jgi:hypothetical protein
MLIECTNPTVFEKCRHIACFGPLATTIIRRLFHLSIVNTIPPKPRQQYQPGLDKEVDEPKHQSTSGNLVRRQQHTFSIRTRMPKPTFMQSVLRKPTRSYADPYGASPWTDSYDEPSPRQEEYTRPSRYESIVDKGAHLGFRERDRDTGGYRSGDVQHEAGPSKPRRAASVVNDYPNRPSSSLSTRFPKPARKVTSTIQLRETVIIHSRPEDQERPARAKSVRKKKTRQRALEEEEQRSEVSSSPGIPEGSASELRRRKKSLFADDDSSLASGPSASVPPSLRRGKDSENSSARSSPIPTMSPIVNSAASDMPRTKGRSKRRPSASVIQKSVMSSQVAPLTPPESESSLQISIAEAVGQMNIGTRPSTSSLRGDSSSVKSPRLPRSACSDSEEEKFYTPRQSLGPPPLVRQVTPPTQQHQSQPQPPADVKLLRPLAPMLSLQPPTPAAMEDMKHSPLEEAESPTGKNIVTSPVSLAPAIDSPSLDDEAETHSLHPAVGSDSESDGENQKHMGDRPPSQRAPYGQGSKSQPHSRQTSFSARPASRTGSLAVVPAHRSSSGEIPQVPPIPLRGKTSGSPSSVGQSSARSSKRISQSVFGDFKVLRRGSGAVSERSFGASDVTPNSGYGKGGWAAAHGTRSNAPSPVMFMPTGANDGWADFQPPPRSSKFTPLPQASQAPTFENMLHHELLGVEDEYSSPSEYSKMSDGEALPQPSRSYTKASYSSNSQSPASEDGPSDGVYGNYDRQYASRSSSEERFNAGRDRRDTIRGPPESQAGPSRRQDSRPPSAMERYSRSSHSVNGSGRYSHSQSPSYTSQFNLPSQLAGSMPPPRPSSVMSVNGTPRGFDAPSFLNPDTLTFLPEMTVEDSSKTYIPDPVGDAQRKAEAIRRTRNSIYSKSIKSAKSVKSAASDEEDDEAESRPPRSRSVLSLRRPASRAQSQRQSQRWEGSTAGEGVLLGSNGLDQTHNGGYTTLIMPTGAYQPANPIKSASEINARVLGLPHAAMAALVLSTASHRLRSDTPAHLRNQLPAPVDFSSHLKPPSKVGDNQVLVQVYAVAIDGYDMAVLDVKGRADVGKWVPGRSFVGRCLQTGSYEKELVRGDLVMGLCDVRKVGRPQILILRSMTNETEWRSCRIYRL